MREIFSNYRTAKKGEGRCPQCANCIEPDWFQKRIRCESHGYAQAVGKTKTCDAFRPIKRDKIK